MRLSTAFLVCLLFLLTAGRHYSFADCSISISGLNEIPSYAQMEPYAESGDAQAQNNLGIYYLGTDTFPRFREGNPHYTEAAKWFARAADQGLPEAQRNLGRLYLYGNGVRQSYPEAYFWAILAILDRRYNRASSQDAIPCEYLNIYQKAGQALTAEQKKNVKIKVARWRPIYGPAPQPSLASRLGGYIMGVFK